MDLSLTDLCTKIVDLVDSGSPLAAVVVLSTQGSTPQCTGARAIVDASGRLWGTVGGGAVEAQVLRAAVEACQSQRPQLLDFDLTSDDAADEGAICGGRMRVLVDPTIGRHRECFVQAASALAARRRGCLLTRIHRSPELKVEMEWLNEDALSATEAIPSNEAIRCAGKGTEYSVLSTLPRVTSQVAAEVFIEPVLPSPLLVIVGGGHVGQAVAAEALRVGFEVTVIDDRPEFAAPALFPLGVRTLCGPITEEIARLPLDKDSFVVLVTRGHRHDAEALAQFIRRPLAYLGMIGSRRKVALVRQHFLETGLATEAEFDCVQAPIGLPIGAVTVPEIAVSIVAQLIAVRRGAVP